MRDREAVTMAPVVLDIGSSLLKIGFAGEEVPSIVMEAAVHGEYVKQNGHIRDWDLTAALVAEAWRQLREKHEVFITPPPPPDSYYPIGLYMCVSMSMY